MTRLTLGSLLAGVGLAAVVLVSVPSPAETKPVPCLLFPPPAIPRLQMVAPPEMTSFTDGEGVDHKVTMAAVDTDSAMQVIRKQAELVVWSKYAWERCGLGGRK